MVVCMSRLNDFIEKHYESIKEDAQNNEIAKQLLEYFPTPNATPSKEKIADATRLSMDYWEILCLNHKIKPKYNRRKNEK